ncbi:MAG TPA: ABC transporter ATP-binding protein [Spirochaetota bacterium]|nr:ABC transporter ATP-binding protein [Spirochaetota bacterium]HRZ26482.1 ABC transporter ATP-binding protein [Spirochaetota bacterium]HSA15802.1 ABC transporter ATP-binding protein [Spirochaetota bacterium]
MIQLENLIKKYDDVVAISNVNLSIRKGVITGLLGPNGAGKTTLVSILTGISKKTAGRVNVGGMDLDSNPDGIKSITGIVPQTLAFYPLLTAYENLEYFGVLYGLQGARLRRRIDFAVEVASLQSFLNRRSGRLSGGMQRRLNLAIGLLHDPHMLYLDEPTVGVDVQSRMFMLEMIRKINEEQKTTILYTSHYISEIQQIADDIVIIDNGSIVLKGEMEKLLSAGRALVVNIEHADEEALAPLAGLTGVVREKNSIYIDRDGLLFSNLIAVVSLLEKCGIDMVNIHYNANKLEELYLKLTSDRLRDGEPQ